MASTSLPRDNYTFVNHDDIPPALVTPFTALFRSMDMPVSDDNYLTAFTPDVTMITGAGSASGPAEIKAMRNELVNPERGPVIDWQHTMGKMFVTPRGREATVEDREEVIFNGSVWYKLLNGKEVDVDWACRAVLVTDTQDGAMKISFYRVYLDSAPLAQAMIDVAGDF